MRPNFELSHLKYFYFTVLEGGVARAADRLCVQQPVVSKMIKGLEGQLGQPLFKRQGRRNLLTDHGQLLYRHCQVIFDEIKKLDQLGNQSPGQLAGTLNLGAAEPIAAHVLPDLIAGLRAQYPAVHSNVYTATANQLLSMISLGKLDLGLFFHVPALPPNCEVVRTKEVRFHLVVATKKKANRAVIERFIGSREIDDLANHRFPTVDFMKRTWPNTRIAYSSNHLGLHRELVLRGEGVSILPDFMVADDFKRKTLTDLCHKERFLFQMKAIARKGGLSPLSELVIHTF